MRSCSELLASNAGRASRPGSAQVLRLLRHLRRIHRPGSRRQRKSGGRVNACAARRARRILRDRHLPGLADFLDTRFAGGRIDVRDERLTVCAGSHYQKFVVAGDEFPARFASGISCNTLPVSQS